MSCHSKPCEHWQKGYLRGEINNVETHGGTHLVYSMDGNGRESVQCGYGEI